MKRYLVKLGMTTTLEFRSTSVRDLQGAVHANLGWWIPADAIVEIAE